MTSRRSFIAMSSAALALPAFAQGIPGLSGPAAAVKRPVDVVKVMSFACSFCLEAESHDRLIEAAVSRTGGRFVRGPVPVEDGATGWRERTYYAARDMDPKFGELVKNSIYRGLQDSAVPLDQLTQLYYWFLQDIPNEEARFNALFERAQAASSNDAMVRAIQLTKNAGARLLPTYILLVDSVIQTALDTSSSKGSSITALREEVIARVEKLSNPKS